ncbi:iron ABC transporter permease [Nocardioides sp. NPDC006273]|uniref:FecCD family ABC transporter permease n=1 Tax=Nocardioides sp. NPDC006273 TaxID=3155598 RepID=UPI0033B80EE6
MTTALTASTPLAPVDPAAPAAAVARGRRLPGIGLILGALVLAAVVSILLGAEWVPPSALFDDGSFGHAILENRIARTATAFAVGGALALGGACLQGLTRNPLADPGLLGLNAGAAFAVVVALVYVGATGLNSLLWAAFVGSALAAILVHGIAAFGRDGATPAKLVLAGAALTAALTSWTSGILLIDHKGLEVFRQWQVGTIGSDWGDLAICAPFLLVGALMALLSAPVLNALALGDDLAKGLGRRTGLDRMVVGVAVVLLCGTATALVGPVAFVGLVVPHAVRALVGPSYALVLPFSIAAGAALTAIADALGRVVLPPTEVQVGIMTAVVGVPAFIWFLRRGRMAGL